LNEENKAHENRSSDRCPRCEKPADLCVCGLLPLLKTRLHVLILQHPQEPREPLGTARLAQLALERSTLNVGLSWPNLGRALGREASAPAWAVLHLGTGTKPRPGSPPGLYRVLRHRIFERLESPPGGLEGLIVLDGTWSQAKALWWRNPWLLRARRLVLLPSQPSLYRNLRREPRREALSTIEALAEALPLLGELTEVGQALRGLFAHLLEKERRRRGR
jgi:DTW domain-containing protein YfiP